MRDQILAEHFARFLRGLVRTLDHLDAAALAAPAGMDLRLDDANRTAELERRSLGFLRRRRDHAARHGNTEALENLLGLILVDVHRFRSMIKRDPKTKRLASGSQ